MTPSACNWVIKITYPGKEPIYATEAHFFPCNTSTPRSVRLFKTRREARDARSLLFITHNAKVSVVPVLLIISELKGYKK